MIGDIIKGKRDFPHILYVLFDNQLHSFDRLRGVLLGIRPMAYEEEQRQEEKPSHRLKASFIY
jgi:hypothetical protein